METFSLFVLRLVQTSWAKLLGGAVQSSLPLESCQPLSSDTSISWLYASLQNHVGNAQGPQLYSKVANISLWARLFHNARERTLKPVILMTLMMANCCLHPAPVFHEAHFMSLSSLFIFLLGWCRNSTAFCPINRVKLVSALMHHVLKCNGSVPESSLLFLRVM